MNELIKNIFIQIKKTIYDYYILQYETDIFTEENKWNYFAAEESLFTYINDKQIWVLDVINTATKEFRIVAALSRETNILKNFIKKYIPPRK